jgi:HK97 family phage portal protein
LHFVKHTVKRWVEQFEQELNLKLWGRSNNRTFAELNVDGLLRGDFGSRMEGYSKSIQNAIMTPNEARRKENLPDNPQGNSLLVQGATVPLGTQPNNSTPTPDAAQA